MIFKYAMNIYTKIILVYLLQITEMLSFMGTGFAFFRILGLKLENFKIQVLPLILGTLGIIAITLVATILNVFFPINHLASCGFILIGLILLVKYKNIFSRLLKYSLKPLILLNLIIFLIALSWGIQIADTFGYHILASKWVAESKIPIGQANLDVRLGLNSLIFTTYSVTEFLVFKINKPFFSFFPIFFSFFIYASIMLLKKSFKKNRKSSFSDYYLISFLLIVAIYNRSFGSLATDLTSIIFAWITFYYVALSSEKKENIDILKLLIIYSAFTTTIKLSMIPICLIAVYCVVVDIKNRIKELAFPIIIAILLAILFIGKGYIQSGYPAFPNTSFSIEKAWKVPTQTTNELREFISNFAKDYSRWNDKEYIKNYKWIPHWIIQFIIYERALWITAILSFLIIIINRFKINMNKFEKLIIITACLGILFVIYNAPAVRFVHAFIYTAILTPLCVLLRNKNKFEFNYRNNPKIPRTIILLSSILLIISSFFIYDNWFGERYLHNFVLKLFPATQTRSLPFVYVAFSVSLVLASFLLFSFGKKLKKITADNETFKIVLQSNKILLSIIIIGSLSHIMLEIPAIFGNHTRLKFPDIKSEINSTNGLTTYHCDPYTCNFGLLTTTYKHDVKAEIINGRYYFYSK